MPETGALRMEVRKHHIQFLDIYRNYVERMGETIGFSPEQKDNLVGNIQMVINNYRKWTQNG